MPLVAKNEARYSAWTPETGLFDCTYRPLAYGPVIVYVTLESPLVA